MCGVALMIMISLVSPSLAATITVLNNADSGAGSLRDAITNPPASNGDIIDFDPGLAGQTIFLLSALPITQNPIEIQLGIGSLNIQNTAGGLALSGITTLNTLALNSDILTIGSSISGVGSLIKAGAGQVILTGTNTYTGGTTVNAGRLTGTTSSLRGNIASTGLTEFDQAVNGTYGGVLSGTGSLMKSGVGVVTLTGTNTYTGATSITGGVLALQGGNAIADTSAVSLTGGTLRLLTNEALGSLDGVIGTTVELNGNRATIGGLGTNMVVDSVISGVGGSITKVGNGTLRLTGANTYDGGTIVNAGVVEGDTVGLQGNFTLAAGTLLRFDQGVAGTYAGVVSGNGSLAKVNAGDLRLTGANTYTGGTVVAAGTLTGDATSLQGNINNSASVVFDQAANGAYAGAMSGGGTLTKIGLGTLSLTGANSYTGGTIITQGTLAGNTTSLQGNITDNSILRFDQNANGTFAGVVSGTGSLVKNGAGNLTLTGPHTYSGGTVVAAGTLTGTTISLQGDIANAAALVFDQSFSGTYAGVISGTGTTTKQGAGTLTLIGASIATGLTNVLAGRLDVDGSLAGDVDVGAGGTLGGVGRVNNLTVRGVLAPGKSIGTLNVGGNFTQAGGSRFDAEIDPSGISDRVVVGGSATIQSGTTLNVIGGAGTFTPGQFFTLVTAAGGITGTYTTVTDDLRFLDATIIPNPNAIIIELLRDVSSIVNAPITLNQSNVATAIGLAGPRFVGDLGAVVDLIVPLDVNQIQDALEQIGGELHADMPSVVLQDYITVNHTISRRLRTIQPGWIEDRSQKTAGSPISAAAAAAVASLVAPYVGATGLGNDKVRNPWSAWGEGYGFRTAVQDDGNARALSFDGHGGLIGLDRAFGLRTLGGLFVGSSTTDGQVVGRLDDAVVDAFRVGVYGRREYDRSTLTGVVSWAENDFDVKRRLLFAGIDRSTRAQYGGNSASAYAEATTHWKRRGWEIYPTASLQYTHIRAGGFGESGANTLNLIGNQMKADSALASVGARVTYPRELSSGRMLVPEARARYMRELRDGVARLFTGQLEGASGFPFTIVGTDMGRDFTILGAGLTYQTSQVGRAFFSYDVQLNDRQDTHTGEAGLQLKF